MKKPIKKYLFMVAILLYTGTVFSQGEESSVYHSESNSKCFKCHGSNTYTFMNDMMEKMVTKRMNPYLIIDSVVYYDQNHNSFECIDCHSYDYQKYPHDSELMMDPLPGCMDCHEGDDATAQYNFEQIDIEYHASVHSTKHSGEFTCWMCHNPHTYKINARNNENILETIVYDNNICLSCHNDVNKYQLITDNTNPSVIESHDWLPNQIAHFSSVRCIECHAASADNVLVAHNIKPKEEAVKKCVECHSKDAQLLASLYKFQRTENRSRFGFFNASMLSDTYVIGANRNVYLNILSLVIFGGVLVLIIVHVILRIKTK